MTVAKRKRLGDDAILVGSSWACARLEEDAHDFEMTVGGGKVEWSGAFGARTAASALGLETRCVDVGAVKDEHAHALLAAARAGGVQRQDAIEIAVGRLTVLERVLDEANVSRGCGVM